MFVVMLTPRIVGAILVVALVILALLNIADKLTPVEVKEARGELHALEMDVRKLEQSLPSLRDRTTNLNKALARNKKRMKEIEEKLLTEDAHRFEALKTNLLAEQKIVLKDIGDIERSQVQVKKEISDAERMISEKKARMETLEKELAEM